MTDPSAAILAFLDSRIAEDEIAAQRIQAELERELKEKYTGMHDEIGPPTPERILSGQLWAIFAGQSKTRNFAKGQYLATMAAPSRVLAECKAKRSIIEEHAAKEIASLDTGTWAQPFIVCKRCAVGDRQIVAPCPTIKALDGEA